MTSKPRLLLAISLVLAAGVLTGAQLGKIAPLVGWYQSDMGFSLVGGPAEIGDRFIVNRATNMPMI